MRTGKKAFTLVELLVVISIIALLLAVLIPALSRAKLLAERVVCAGRERDASTAFLAYAAGIGNGKLPIGAAFKDREQDDTVYLTGRKWSLLSNFSNESWNNLTKYMKDSRTLMCPSYAKTIKDPNYFGYPYIPQDSTWRHYRLGYNYHGGHFAEKWVSGNPTIKPWRSPYRTTDPGNLVVLSDFINQNSSYYSTDISHGPRGYMKGKINEDPKAIALRSGSNIAYFDGSVRWKNLQDMDKHFRGKSFSTDSRVANVTPINNESGGTYYPYGYW